MCERSPSGKRESLLFVVFLPPGPPRRRRARVRSCAHTVFSRPPWSLVKPQRPRHGRRSPEARSPAGRHRHPFALPFSLPRRPLRVVHSATIRHRPRPRLPMPYLPPRPCPPPASEPCPARSARRRRSGPVSVPPGKADTPQARNVSALRSYVRPGESPTHPRRRSQPILPPKGTKPRGVPVPALVADGDSVDNRFLTAPQAVRPVLGGHCE